MANNLSQLSDSEYIKLMLHRLNHLRFVEPLPLIFFNEEELPEASHRHSYYELRLLAKEPASDFIRLEIAPPGVMHHSTPMGFYRGCRIVTVNVRGDVRSYRGDSDGNPVGYISDPAIGRFILRQIEMIRSAIDENLPGELLRELFGTLVSLLMLAFRKFRRYENQFRNDSSSAQLAIDYIHINYSRSDLSVSDVAAAAGVSTTYLPQLFRSVFDMTVRQMIVKVRLRRACELLAFGEHSIREISMLCGWNDHSFFSNTFRKHFQMTPAQYAKKYHHGHIRNLNKFKEDLDVLLSENIVL